jgi:hypothetical protein
MRIDLNRISAIDFLIRHKSTGCPESFATRLSISKRTLHFTLSHMKDVFNAPIEYDRHRKTYFYSEDGYVIISFQRSKQPLDVQSPAY